MIPKANDFVVEHAPYRDYGKDRKKLLSRIIDRIEETCIDDDKSKTTQQQCNNNVKEAILHFLMQWFDVKRINIDDSNNNNNNNNNDDSSSNNNNDDSNNNNKSVVKNSKTTKIGKQTILYKEDMDKFLAWAFFGKHYHTMESWELKELNIIYKKLKKRNNIIFPSVEEEENNNNNTNSSNGTTHPFPVVVCKPRRMTLEPMDATYRPLIFYLVTRSLYWIGALYLFIIGYRRCVSKSTGLVAWHRRPRRRKNNKNTTEKEERPLLFFHGISPGGFMPYLPMIFCGLLTDDRPVFFFDNRTISMCFFDFAPLTEQQTIQGIIEILRMNDCFGSELSIVGHSFGSCTVTWLLQSTVLKPFIKQAILLDPVSILLSEADVMINFLYGVGDNTPLRFISTELFVQYSVRRHFFWYNNELWLDDIDDSCSVLICLSGDDNIIDAQKVKAEVVRHKSKKKKKLDLLFWEGASHADCVTSPQLWKEMKQYMLQQQESSKSIIRKKKNN